jgi:tetratricopeptide (TPR) repeat protein
VITVTSLTTFGCDKKTDKPPIVWRPGLEINVQAQGEAPEKIARARQFEDLLASGKAALKDKRLDEAVKSLEEALRFQDTAEARELFEQARKARDDARRAAYQQAMLQGGQAAKQQDYPAAIAAFRDALRQLPDDEEAATALQEAEFHDFREQGRLAIENQRYADAIKALEGAVKRQPDDTASQDLLQQARMHRRSQVFSLGKAALDTKQFPEAVRHLTEASDLLPDAEVTALLAEANFHAKLLLGRQRVEASQFAAAIPDLEEASRLKPDHAETKEILQQAKDGKKRQDKAEYDRASAAGDAAMQRKDYPAAINAYREALARQPQDSAVSAKLTKAQTAKSKKDAYDGLAARRRTVKQTIDSTKAQLQSADSRIQHFKFTLSATPAQARSGIEAMLRSAEFEKRRLTTLLTSSESELRSLDSRLATPP